MDRKKHHAVMCIHTFHSACLQRLDFQTTRLKLRPIESFTHTHGFKEAERKRRRDRDKGREPDKFSFYNNFLFFTDLFFALKMTRSHLEHVHASSINPPPTFPPLSTQASRFQIINRV